MKTFSGYAYLLIDIANNNGRDTDKLTFEERIQWTEAHMDMLETIAKEETWKERPLYLKAVQALRKVQQGLPTGHLAALDAVCSGLQIMSAASGCITGARATGLVDPDRRADAYTECSEIMSTTLGRHIPNERQRIKDALMTALYGSKAEPRDLFGEDTPELQAFYQAMYQIAPGACALLQTFLDSWQPWALEHAWHLPDGYYARVKVIQKKEKRIEVDELHHATFTYAYTVNAGEKRGVKNAANITHSIDGWVLRNMVRRCNYDKDTVETASWLIETELLRRNLGDTTPPPTIGDSAKYYLDLYTWFQMADPVILPHLNQDVVQNMQESHLHGLAKILNSMLEHEPFSLITVHDCFSAHPNNLNWVRKHYRDILAELADSGLVDRILSEIQGTSVHFPKLSPDLGDYIRQSEYALS